MRPETNHSKQVVGILAEFNTTHDLYNACEKIRDQGIKKWESYSPFPVHGLDKAMGVPSSGVPWIILIGGMGGAIGGMVLQWWISVIEFPLVISGKPFFSWPAFIPITFELGILGGALGAFLGMLGLCKLPKYNDPLFNYHRFERATNDKF